MGRVTPLETACNLRRELAWAGCNHIAVPVPMKTKSAVWSVEMLISLAKTGFVVTAMRCPSFVHVRGQNLDAHAILPCCVGLYENADNSRAARGAREAWRRNLKKILTGGGVSEMGFLTRTPAL